jgi:methyl-accepting chemotaxis protein
MDAFKGNVEIVKQIGGLMEEIAAASDDQAQGIEQINTAVMEMDKITQQNTANSEESASAAEEMDSQAENMMNMVDSLILFVEGKNQKGVFKAETRQKTPKTAKQGKTSKVMVTKGAFGNSSTEKSVFKKKSGELSPDEIIPLNDDEFNDF